MASILYIGRAGLDLELADPRDISESRSAGGTSSLNITGQIKGLSTVVQAKALKEDLLSMSGRVVPIVYTTDSTIDGYYRINSVQVETDRQFSPYTIGVFPFSLSAERVDSPVFEIYATGGLLPNELSITATNNAGICGLPATATWVRPPSGQTSSSVLDTADGNDARIFYAMDPGDTGPTFSLAPGDYYDAACSVWVDGRLFSGARRLPSFTSVVVTNDLLRVTAGTAITQGNLQVEHHDGTAWRVKTWNPTFAGVANENGAWQELYIIRNDPEEVRIRLVKYRTTGALGRLVLTLTVCRGWRLALIHLHADDVISMGMKRAESEAGSALSPAVGITAAANDANGHRYLLLTSEAHSTVDLTGYAGIIDTDSDGNFFCAVGMTVDYASPDGGAGESDLINQFFNHLEIRQRLVATVVV